MITVTDWADLLQFSFFWKSLIAAGLAGLLCGFIGPYLAWKNLGLFGASLSHASLFPIALGIVFGLPLDLYLYPFVAILALVIAYLKEKELHSLDTYLAIFYSGFMAFGILLLNYYNAGSTDLIHYLFGEILVVTWIDIYLLTFLFGSILIFAYRFRKALLLNLVQPEIAMVEISYNKKLHYISYLFIGLCMAACIKIMGIVLLTSLMMVPTAIASRFTKSINQHFILCMFLGASLALGGIFLSVWLNLPSGASIASLAMASFFVSMVIPSKKST